MKIKALSGQARNKMKTKHNLLQLFLAGALLLPAVVQAQFTFTTNNGAITITGYTGSNGTGVIPDATNGYPVTAIADYAFYGNTTLTNLAIPDSVTNIGVMEFQACSGLTNVTVDGANPDYASAGGVLFDKAMTTLLQCPGGLAGSYTIPNGVINLANNAFLYCFLLSGVTIPNTVISIGDWAFSNCGLTNATIPASVTNLSMRAFTGGDPLATITVDAANPKYASADGVLFDKAMATVLQFPPARAGSYAIPGSVTNIGDYAFMYSRLSSVTIPASVTSIGYQSFWNNNSLTTVVIPDSVASLGDYSFYACYGLKSVTVGSGVTSINDQAFASCPALTNLTVAAGNAHYASAGGVLFDKAMATLLLCPEGLASYAIPNGVTSIADDAFDSCQNLTNVTIASSVTSIGNNAFYECSSLTSVTIPNNVGSIGWQAFYDCSGLISVTIGSGVSSLGDSCFANCANLIQADFQGDAPLVDGWEAGKLDTSVFSGETGTVYYVAGTAGWDTTFGGWPTALYRSPWADFIYVTNNGAICITGYTGVGGAVTIPDTINGLTVASIEAGAFQHNSSLTNLTIPAGITNLGSLAFSDCANLTGIYFAGNAPGADLTVFAGDNQAIVYYLPGATGWSSPFDGLLAGQQNPPAPAGDFYYTTINGAIIINGYYGAGGDLGIPGTINGLPVIGIGDYAFYSCGSLTSVTVPNSVTNIGNYSFYSCYNLTSVTIGNGVASLGDSAFAECGSLTNVMIGRSVTQIGDWAFQDSGSPLTIVCLGNAPQVDGTVFDGDDPVTIYYLPDTTGWSSGFDGLTAVLWTAPVPPAYTFTTNSDGTITITGYIGTGGDVIIPDTINGLTVTRIGAGAFQHNHSLTSITIPAGITNFGSLAFSDCANLTEIYFLGNAPAEDLTLFAGDNHAIVYYPPGGTGWSSPFDGLLAGQQNPPAPAGDFYYTTVNGAVIITGYHGAGGDLGIPSSINSLPVVSIGYAAFSSCGSLTSVTIPDSVTNLGNYAFGWCNNLTSVTIGNGVASIGYEAFFYCYNLTNVMIGKSVAQIGSWAFGGCGSPLTIDCLGNAPQVDSTVFNGDNLATIYYLPDTTGWNSRFDGLTAVLWTAPAPPAYIYTINNDGTITITSYNGTGGDVTIPDTINGLTVTRIGAGAFQHNHSLTNLTIPAGITNFGSLAFSDCINLTGIYFLGNAPAEDLTVFSGDNHAVVYYPPGATGWSSPFDGLLAGQQNPPAPAGDFYYTTVNGAVIIAGYHGAGGDIGIPSTIAGLPVVSIGYAAFSSCGSLTSVTIPDSVTNLGNYAFGWCYHLTSVVIGNGVASIGYEAFDYCYNLTNVMIGKSVTQLGDWAFEDCGSLLTIDCLGNAPQVDSTVFNGDNLATIYYLPDTTGWNSRFDGLTAVLWTAPAPPVTPVTLTYITNSDNTITITGCTGGGDATIPNTIGGRSVTAIGNGAFQNNDSLTSITIPAGVTNLGSSAFAGCTKLTGIYCLGNAPGADLTVFAGDNHATLYYLPGTQGWSSPFAGMLAELQNPLSPVKDFTYMTNNNAIIITGYSGAGGDIGIPGTITGLPVVSIGDDAFEDSSLTSVTIPNSVTNLGNYAFDSCYNLTSITLGNNIASIGTDAFAECNGLTNAMIGNNVANIGDYAFEDCSSLTAFTVSALNAYYSSADGVLFDQGQTLLIQFPAGNPEGDYMLPASVTSIGDYAFENCTSLTNITMGSNVASIGMGVFWSCSGLTTVVIPNSVTSIGNSAFYACSGLTNVTLGNRVTVIGSGAFEDCGSLTTIVIPASVSYLEDYVFDECGSLTAITVDPANPYYCSPNGVLFNHDQTTLMQYPEAKTGSYIIPDSVTSFGYSAFNYCTNLTSLAIDNKVASIENYLFYGCSSLVSVSIGTGVTNLGYDAFAYCTSLASVTIPGQVTSIGSEAFSGDSSLTNVMIPASVTSIGSYAFAYCSSLTAITVAALNPVYSSLNGVLFDGSRSTLIQFPGGVGGSYTVPATVTNIVNNAFAYCPNLACVTIPDNVISIGVAAFADCYGLTNVTIGNGITSISESAFEGCSLTSLTIGANVVSIGDNAFSGCPLASVTIPNRVTSIGYAAFSSDSSLTNLIIGNSVTNIGEDAFDFCTRLASVTFPASVTSIGYAAFYYCTNLTGAYFMGNAPSGGDSYVFYYDYYATVYKLPVATGWTSQFGSRPVAQWNLPPQISQAGVGGGLNQFSFNLVGYSGQVIVVEVCTNLAKPVWLPVETNTLIGGSAAFSDPQYTNYPGRFYRLRSP